MVSVTNYHNSIVLASSHTDHDDGDRVSLRNVGFTLNKDTADYPKVLQLISTKQKLDILHSSRSYEAEDKGSSVLQQHVIKAYVGVEV